MKQLKNVSAGARGRLWRSTLAAAAAAAGLCAGAATAAGCVGTVGAEGALVYGYPAARATVVPLEIQAYPRVYFRGDYAYLVDGSWYYPTRHGWMVFQDEPRELRRYRLMYQHSPRYVVPEREYEPPRERSPRQYTPR